MTINVGMLERLAACDPTNFVKLGGGKGGSIRWAPENGRFYHIGNLDAWVIAGWAFEQLPRGTVLDTIRSTTGAPLYRICVRTPEGWDIGLGCVAINFLLPLAILDAYCLWKEAESQL